MMVGEGFVIERVPFSSVRRLDSAARLREPARLAIPAETLHIPPDHGITYATADLRETVKVFERYGVRLLTADEIASEMPAFPQASSQPPSS